MRRSICFLVVLVALIVQPVIAQDASPVATPETGPVTVAASGLINPRGFLWTADGTLYVAQAGTGGESLGTPTLAPPVGPVGGGPTASVVRIDGGCPVLVAGGLPSTKTALTDVLGAEDLAVLGDQLYAAVDGGGEAHGNAAQPSGVYRILENGTTELVADLSAWVRANPVANLTYPDVDPDAAGFSLVADAATETFWVVDPNGGQILNVALDGTTSRIVDLSEGHPVPTGLAAAPQGGVYVGFLTAAPFSDGTSRVIHVAPEGAVTEVWTGLTAVVDVVVGADGSLYAVEMTTNNTETPPFMVPGSGRIVRQTGPDSAEEIATGLMFPISAAFGPDGGLFVSLPAIGADNGEGVIARLDGAASPIETEAEALAEMAMTAGCSPVT